MRGVQRGRYEGALSQIARGARSAAKLLDEEGKQEEAMEFALLAAWAHSEFERSSRDKPPLHGQLSLFRQEREQQA